jgi:hypothetical protein
MPVKAMLNNPACNYAPLRPLEGRMPSGSTASSVVPPWGRTCGSPYAQRAYGVQKLRAAADAGSRIGVV